MRLRDRCFPWWGSKAENQKQFLSLTFSPQFDVCPHHFDVFVCTIRRFSARFWRYFYSPQVEVFSNQIRRFLFAPYRRFSTRIWHSADLIKTDCCTSFRRFPQTLSAFSVTLIRRITQPYLGVFTTLFRCFLRPIRHFQMQFPLFELLTSLGEMHSSV